MRYVFRHKGQSFEVPDGDAPDATIERAISELGPWDEASKLEPLMSTFTATVHDADAEARNRGVQEKLAAAGVAVDESRQLFATGTRMAVSGYKAQEKRREHHDARMPITDAVEKLIARVASEKRRDIDVSARELARSIESNGKLKVGGYVLQPQAIRGLFARAESPAATYAFGLRERQGKDDARMLASVVEHELMIAGDTMLRMRVREALGDCFAIVSESYGVADAPSVLPEVLDALPRDARAEVSYNPATTSWELRAFVHTPTPTEQQAVGEAFEGYTSFGGIDNGTGRLTGGGGIIIVICLNASTYVAPGANVSRVHRGRVLYDIAAMAREAARAVHTLIDAWSVARDDVAEAPKLIPVEDVLPGFYRAMLTDRRSELVGVLPGRREEHVVRLAHAFNGERRNKSQIVRADLAQGWTRYIQEQPADVQRDAERAIAGWLTTRAPLRWEARKAS